ncbi:hypothetical protein CIL03_08600 [Virgibacillus indicus]|uniref:Uncharacterized protein n=1 Tax=Virgibacillus indicus TaxID=2024554 RepID=A0A265NB96_9BACI|nr:hypothetical protein [Virgibacillus indicus]OZU89065.1 hypothetical protein CIL03_08600 [Virgibacillus indicus]
MPQNYNKCILFIEEFDNHKSIWVRLRAKHVTIESRGPMCQLDAEGYIDRLIEKYQLKDEVTIVNKCFGLDGKLEIELKDTVKGYLHLKNKNR